MTRLVVTAFGRCVGLDVPDELGEQARRRLPPGSVPSTGTPERMWQLLRARADGDWLASRDQVTFAGGPDPVPLLDLLTGDLELWVAEHAEGLIFVHAGAVTWRGRAIVIPGRSMSGKSTLVAALVRAGADYLSDEYAVIAADGIVHPYPRPLSMRRDRGPAERIPVECLGGVVSEPVPLGLVAHLSYRPGQTLEVDVLSPAATLLALMDNTVPARSRPLEVMDHLSTALLIAIGMTGFRGNADSAAITLIDRMTNSKNGPK